MYDVGDKFIVEIGSVFKDIEGNELYKIKDFNSLVFDSIGLNKLELFDAPQFADLAIQLFFNKLKSVSSDTLSKWVAESATYEEFEAKLDHATIQDVAKVGDIVRLSDVSGRITKIEDDNMHIVVKIDNPNEPSEDVNAEV